MGTLDDVYFMTVLLFTEEAGERRSNTSDPQVDNPRRYLNLKKGTDIMTDEVKSQLKSTVTLSIDSGNQEVVLSKHVRSVLVSFACDLNYD